MNNRIKDYLGIAGIAVLVMLILTGLQFSAAYSRAVPPSATFAASGEGRVVAVPDTAQFSFGITTEGGKDIAALQKANTDKANAAIAFVKSKGVDAKDIATQSYNVEPRYQYFSCPPIIYSSAAARDIAAPTIAPKPCPPSEVIGYTVSQTILVKIRDFSKIGDILAGVTEKGANNVSGLTFTVHDKTAVENEARAKAVAEAQAKAKALAKVGHFRLGRVLSIQEGGNQPPIYYAKMEAGGRGGGDVSAPAPTIEPGSQEIVSNITITYEIR